MNNFRRNPLKEKRVDLIYFCDVTKQFNGRFTQKTNKQNKQIETRS